MPRPTQPCDARADRRLRRADDQAALHEHLGQALHAPLGDTGQVSANGVRIAPERFERPVATDPSATAPLVQRGTPAVPAPLWSGRSRHPPSLNIGPTGTKLAIFPAVRSESYPLVVMVSMTQVGVKQPTRKAAFQLRVQVRETSDRHACAADRFPACYFVGACYLQSYSSNIFVYTIVPIAERPGARSDDRRLPQMAWDSQGPAPATHYQLLGIAPDEQDIEVIEAAAVRQVAFVRNFQAGPHAEQCSRILTELAEARLTLLNPAKRQAVRCYAWPPRRKASPRRLPRTPRNVRAMSSPI